jgi:curli biogenesis system outer membrane secretion channel CsgG
MTFYFGHHEIQRPDSRCAFAAVPAYVQDTTSTVEKGERSLGTIAVSENQGASQHQLQSDGLGSPVSLLRIMIQQSNCFTVVERGVAMQALQEERALAANGETLGGSNVGKGQLQAADFVMTQGVQFTAGDTGGIGGVLSSYGGKFLGGLGGIVGGVASNIKFKEAQTSPVAPGASVYARLSTVKVFSSRAPAAS